MAKRRMSKQSKRRLFLFGTISIVMIIYCVFSASYYAISIYKLKKQESELNDNLTELKHNEKLLNTEIDKLKDNDYIARYARENYSYSKDGEIIIKLDDSKKEKKEEKKYEINQEKIMKICSIIILLILGYVIIKSRKKQKSKKKGK